MLFRSHCRSGGRLSHAAAEDSVAEHACRQTGHVRVPARLHGTFGSEPRRCSRALRKRLSGLLGASRLGLQAATDSIGHLSDRLVGSPGTAWLQTRYSKWMPRFLWFGGLKFPQAHTHGVREQAVRFSRPERNFEQKGCFTQVDRYFSDR